MRIAMVSEHASPLAALGGEDAGGQNVHVAALSAALARAGHQVTVYTRRDGPRQRRVVRSPVGVLVERVPVGPPQPVPKDTLLPYMTEFGAYLAQRFEREPPDVAHAHFWMSGLATIAGAEDAGVPVVQTFHALGAVKRRHQGDADTSPANRVLLERTVGRRCSRVVATCSDEVFELIRMGVDRRRVSIVPCGVDTATFTPAGRRARRSGRPRILVVGRLVERKGVETVIRALAAVPEAELLVAGGPATREMDSDRHVRRLRAVAARAGVADRVTLLGSVSRRRMPALLRSADVVVCVPWYEPFGIVPLEAMACGVPVVASAVGGLTDTVVDGATGVLVPPRRPDRLAAALRGLLADPARRAAYGAAGVERARARYDWDRVAADTAAVYARLAGARTPLRREVGW
jgi:glycosyltransferase involved in cell wall biosynthesis